MPAHRHIIIFVATIWLILSLGGVDIAAQEPTGGAETGSLAAEIQATVEKTAAFRQRIAEAPDALERVKASIDGENGVPPIPDENLSLEDLQERLETAKAELDSARASARSYATEKISRTANIQSLQDRLTLAQKAVGELLETPPLPATASEAEREQYELQLEQQELLQKQLEAIEAERDFYKETSELFAAEETLAALRVTRLEGSVAAWQGVVDQRRQVTTAEAVRQAEQDVGQYADNPEAKLVAMENAQLAERHRALSKKMAIAASSLSTLQAERARISKQHASATRRVELFEEAELPVDPNTGQLLRKQRQSLTGDNSLREQLRSAMRESAQAQFELISIEERDAELASTPPPREPAGPAVTSLEDARKGQLKVLANDYREYIATLTATTSTLRSLMSETKEFAGFVDKRLLWIRSTEPLGISAPEKEFAAIVELLRKSPFTSLRDDLISWTILWVFAAGIIAWLISKRKRFLENLDALGAEARKRNCTSYLPTARAFGYSLLIAAPLPAIALFFYWRSAGAPAGVVEALRNVAAFLTCMTTFWIVAHPRGLMVDHFRISDERVAPLRKNFGWFIFVMPALIFFATALPIEASGDSAGRLFFITLLAVLMVFLFRVLRPGKKLIYWRGKASSPVAKACFALGIIAPLALIGGAAAGYFDSVQELRFQLLFSVWIVLVTIFFAAMCHRWILVSRRRLAVQQALNRRASMVAERTAPSPATADPKIKPQSIASPDEVKAEALKVVKVEEQTARLVRVAAITIVAFGLFGIWRQTVPALSALDKVTLWTEKGQESTKAPPTADGMTGTLTGNQAAAAPGASEQSDNADGAQLANRVTLQDLATSLIALLLTFVAARNIPGLLELTVFRRLSLKPGTSFAFTTTIRYIILVTGVVVALGMIDITWGKVQWIAAAITLGIGFGLQEIFANFVAGLIILFERPIRLGDVVTVGDVSGKVSQIRIRATTIRQFNSRELIVPNKEFITGKLVNWTLSDSILRFEIIVGIAYGSDTRQATAILLKVANDCPRVLKEPAPDVLFDDFGNSALIFQLRAHVGHIDNLLPARNEIRYAIDDAFREADIEIAFPQTDIHIRSQPDGEEIEIPKM